jgi:hypothetical protein
MDNQDLINAQNSFNKLATLTLPKGMLTLLAPDRWHLPTLASSYGEAFHIIDRTRNSLHQTCRNCP